MSYHVAHDLCINIYPTEQSLILPGQVSAFKPRFLSSAITSLSESVPEVLLCCSRSLFSFEHLPLNHCWALRLPLLGVCSSLTILVGMAVRAGALLHFSVLCNFGFMKRDFPVGRKKKRSRKDHSPGQWWRREAVGKSPWRPQSPWWGLTAPEERAQQERPQW